MSRSQSQLGLPKLQFLKLPSDLLSFCAEFLHSGQNGQYFLNSCLLPANVCLPWSQVVVALLEGFPQG